MTFSRKGSLAVLVLGNEVEQAISLEEGCRQIEELPKHGSLVIQVAPEVAADKERYREIALFRQSARKASIRVLFVLDSVAEVYLLEAGLLSDNEVERDLKVALQKAAVKANERA